jgi:hypothetical protein
MTRRLTNQDAFDGAMLHLLKQGHSCLSASGQARYRSPRGKSAIGALIPDELYATSMEGKPLHHWLAARGSEYDALRERFGSVTPSLLADLQDLHDRSGACMPSLYRHLVLAGAQRIAQNFKLSMRLVLRCAAYQHMRGPQIFSGASTRAIPATAPAVHVPLSVGSPPTSNVAPTVNVAPAVDSPPAIDVAAAVNSPPAVNGAAAVNSPPAVNGAAAVNSPPAVNGAPAVDVPPAIDAPLAAAPTSAPKPVQLTERPEEELDLIARGIAKAIAAASAPGVDRHPGRR